MAYDPVTGNPDGGKTSEFNAGVLQMQRIHILQERMNNANLNRLYVDPETEVHNYEIIISCANSLLREIYPKLSGDEKKDGKKLRDNIQSYIQKYPPYKMNKNVRVGSSQINLILDETNWQILDKYITIYYELVTTFLDDHELNSPSKKGDALF